MKLSRCDRSVIIGGIAHHMSARLVLILLGVKYAPAIVVMCHNASSLLQGGDPQAPDITGRSQTRTLKCSRRYGMPERQSHPQSGPRCAFAGWAVDTD